MYSGKNEYNGYTSQLSEKLDELPEKHLLWFSIASERTSNTLKRCKLGSEKNGSVYSILYIFNNLLHCRAVEKSVANHSSAVWDV